MTDEKKQHDEPVEIELDDLELEHVPGGSTVGAYVSSDLRTVTIELPEPLKDTDTRKFGFRGKISRKR
jgi:hypothetical protein